MTDIAGKTIEYILKLSVGGNEREVLTRFDNLEDCIKYAVYSRKILLNTIVRVIKVVKTEETLCELT